VASGLSTMRLLYLLLSWAFAVNGFTSVTTRAPPLVVSARTTARNLRLIISMKAPTAAVTPPSTALTLAKQLWHAPVKSKLIVAAHVVPLVGVYLVVAAIARALVNNASKPEKKFYGISKPMAKPRSKSFFTLPSLQLPSWAGPARAVAPATPVAAPAAAKQRNTVAAVAAVKKPAVSSASLAHARAQVLKILAAVDEATLKATQSSNRFVGSFRLTALLSRDPEKVALEAYKARNKQAEKQRRMRYEKIKAAEMRAQKEAEAARLAAEKRRLQEAHASAPAPLKAAAVASPAAATAAAAAPAPAPTSAPAPVSFTTVFPATTNVRVTSQKWSPHMAVGGAKK